MSHSGGCQCGAVRFRVEDEALGRASICHCRMCQKAFGGFFGPLVTAKNSGLTWTRGAPTYFHSSNLVSRGFCANCGTPLTYIVADETTEVAIGAFDDPTVAPPVKQLQVATALPYFARLHELPVASLDAMAGLVSYQHPDHDTETWPTAGLD
jgi:hypothetical protein